VDYIKLGVSGLDVSRSSSPTLDRGSPTSDCHRVQGTSVPDFRLALKGTWMTGRYRPSSRWARR
jgi:hypothetical protein